MTVVSLLSRLKELEITVESIDDRLKINAPEGKLTPDLLEQLKEHKEGVIRFLRKAQQGEEYTAIEPVEQKEYYALSSAQKRLYFIQQMAPETTAYNIPMSISPDTDSDSERLESIFAQLIARHESLRTSFHMIDEEPIQRIHDKVEVKVEEETRSPGALYERFVQPFDLSQAPLLRVGLIKTGEGKSIFLIDMHHIITDGTSQKILTDEFMKLCAGETLEPLRLQYKDYSEWQGSENRKAVIKKQEEYWLKTFEEKIPILNLPTDYPRPLTQSFEGSHVEFRLEANQAIRLREMAEEFDATLYILFLSLFNVFLSKLSDQEDIIIGTPIAARRHIHLKKIIGMFVNTLPMRNYPAGEKSFAGFLKEVKQNTIKVYENQEYPFEELVEKVSEDSDVSRNPLFDVMFVLQNFNTFREETSVREIVGEENVELTPAKFDLTLEAVEADSEMVLNFNYSTSLFKRQAIEKFIAYFKKIVTMVATDAKIKISGIEIISAEEKERILYDFNNTETGYPGSKAIHELFEEQAERTPDNVAGVANCQLAVGGAASPANKGESSGETVQLTYKELNEKSNRLALVLIEKGVLADDIAAIMVERSIEMIIGILGILKAGGAYLPIDPDYPQERIDYMLKDSSAKVLVRMVGNRLACSAAFEPSTSTLTSTCQVSSANLAYIIYTSGTTGRPKGVGVEHRQAVNTLLYRREAYGMNAKNVSLQLFSFSFDGFVTSFFTPVISGAKVVLPGKEEIKDVTVIKDTIARHGVTHFISIPGFYRAVLDSLGSGERVALKVVTLAGDKLSPHLLELSLEKNKDIEIAHEYGVTEAAVMSTLYRHQEENEQVKIGAPIGNVGIYILDRSGHMQPVGLPGEMCIAGAGVTRGYLNNPELTAEKFCLRRPGAIFIKTAPGPRKNLLLFPSPVTQHSSPLYKTGDLGRWLGDGNIEFLGRIDQQVKIRGFRIELEEIESRLLAYPGIKAAVVIDWKSPGGEKYLCAYIVPHTPLSADSTVSIGAAAADLEAFLSQSLPDYMIPSYFMQLEKIPLTPNGKIDRKALPAPGLKQEEYIAPRNDIEEKLVEIWAEVMGIEKEEIGIDNNFFRLGGHSLKATTAMSHINRELGVRVPLVELFKTPTIRQLGEYINSVKGEIADIRDDQLVLLRRVGGKAKPIFFIHDGSGEVEGYIEFCNRLNTAYNSWGIQAQKIENYTPLNLSIEQVAQSCIEKIRIVQAHGPYHMAGWSIGGTIGFEMVRQLEEQNEEIGFFALIDTVPPDKELQSRGIEFNLASELEWIPRFFPDETIIKKLEGIEDFHRLWPEILAYVEAGEVDTVNADTFKYFIPDGFVQTVPNLDKMTIREFISYLNTVRTFENTRNKYIPGGKIDTVVHFFKSSEMGVNAEKWNVYCKEPIRIYHITGDHYSIFKVPGVIEFAKLFDRVINQKVI
jgi:amino acid adenylation domain-containing protein